MNDNQKSSPEFAEEVFEMFKDSARPTGVTIDGKNVPLETIYKKDMLREMDKWGCD